MPIGKDENKKDSDHEPEAKVVDAVESHGLTTTQVEALRKKWGWNELEEKKIPKWKVFLLLLTPPMPMMIWIAIFTELFIENWIDAGILFFIQMMNASIAFYETTKAGDAVAALKSALKPQAVCVRDGKQLELDAKELVPGDLILLASGGSVPADSFIHEGEIEVDNSALNGESVPAVVQTHQQVMMGSNVVKGHVHATVTKTGKFTYFGEAAELMKKDKPRSNLEKLLIKIILVLVVCSLTLCTIAFIYILLMTEVTVKEALSFTVVLMVASIPLAIEIVCTTTLALGSRQMARFGAIVSRLSAIEDLAGLTVLCSDKTGTLTLNKMEIQSEYVSYLQNFDLRELLRHAAMAAKWTEPPRDALDKLVLGAADLKSLADVKSIKYIPFDPTFKRTEGTVQLPSGEVFRVTKGAPDIILKLCNMDTKFREDFDAKVTAFGERGIRCLAVAKTVSDEWKMAGIFCFLDPPRPDTKDTIEKANRYGVAVKMITGDHTLIARETARSLGMGTNILHSSHLPTLDENGDAPKDLVEKFGRKILETDGFAQMYPSHKHIVVDALQRMGLRVGMTGDGVNDAPALKVSDVGIAVHGATDTARAASAIVLTHEGLSTIIDGIVVSRQIFQRMNSFLTYRIAATLQLLTFSFIAVLSFNPSKYEPNPKPPGFSADEDWPHYFQMPVLMLMFITLLNDGTLISIGYDNVTPTQFPNKWNVLGLFIVSGVLGLVAMLSSLLLLWCCLDSWRPGSVFQNMGIGGLSYGHITNVIYLKVSVSDFLTLFSARTNHEWFGFILPNKVLGIAGMIALSISTILAMHWPVGWLDGVQVEGLAHNGNQHLAAIVWLYCILVWLVQDFAKVMTHKLLKHYGFYTTPILLSDGSTYDAGKLSGGASAEGLELKVKVLGSDGHH